MNQDDLSQAIAPVGAAERPLRVVGLGASAGGLAALEAFFRSVPTDAAPGMAFVVVQHLAPDHPSILSQIIQRCTSMQAFEIQHGMPVLANCIYVIPPDRGLLYVEGRLMLQELTPMPGGPRTIDTFFSSLARHLNDRAVGIVLSGSGSDGAMGLRAIKEAGGLVIVQTPASAQFRGMPQSAMETGVVDLELSPDEMPVHLMNLTDSRPGKRGTPPVGRSSWSVDAYAEVMDLLRSQTGHDFSQYKLGTMRRRIERRTSVQQLESLSAYADYLRRTPGEVRNLYFELPIGVTAFFRDPEAFQVLELDVLPSLLATKDPSSELRIWSLGCSSGEEPYSIGMLVTEAMERQKKQLKVQIFATDLNSRAISVARAGVYPASIGQELSPSRLSRFFTLEPGDGTYRVVKCLRDMMVFSEHDVIRDPPFSRLDLIVCRNLLIYFEGDLQKRLIPLFHYALKPGGVLFLGSSESVGENGELFSVLDRRAKLFQRREVSKLTRPSYTTTLLPKPPPDAPPNRGPEQRQLPMKTSLRDMAEQALLRMTPASALVNAQGDIRYLHGRTGQFLEPAPGEAGVNNILRMAREGLRPALDNALREAAMDRGSSYAPRVQVRTNGHFASVNLSVRHVASTGGDASGEALYLVVFEESVGAQLIDVAAQPGSSGVQSDDAPEGGGEVQELQRALRLRDEHIKSLSDALERSSEELRSSNEEMQAVNEELQSTNEELETSKEELQAVNEELTTVNTELQIKVADLSRANNDMNNLLAGTGIGTLFVDHDLRILRFTPATSTIINLIPGDVGRPIGHIASNLVGYGSLVDDVMKVLSTLENFELDVQTSQGRWYTMHIRPYRTLDYVIEGAVITFVDITEVRAAQEALRKAAGLSHLAHMLHDADAAMVIEDAKGRIQTWNDAARRLYGWNESEAMALHAQARVPAHRRDDHEQRITALRAGDTLPPWKSRRLRKDSKEQEVWVTACALGDGRGQLRGLVWVEQAVGPSGEASRRSP
ncbi:MAG: CheR family methyltransferase [Hydrogenophaga sp.]|uniref:CheR family methyltransferase n=1 Tax=Hydrogenophaga sp. TaxID=1904254 RepID=UPI003D0E6646